jgi:hypothetical protein
MESTFDPESYTLTAPDASILPETSWPVLSNGLLAVVPCLSRDDDSGLDFSRCVLGSSTGTVSDLCNFARVRVSVGDGVDVTQPVSGVPVTLDMKRGVLSSTFVSSTPVPGSGTVAVTHEIRALMHLPGFALHTVTVAVEDDDPGTQDMTQGRKVQFVHEVEDVSSQNVDSRKFTGESVTAEDGRTVFFLTCTPGNASCVSVYLVDERDSSVLGCPGHNESIDGTTGWSVLNTVSPILPIVPGTPGVPGVPERRRSKTVVHVLTACSSTRSTHPGSVDDVANTERDVNGRINTGTDPTPISRTASERRTDADDLKRKLFGIVGSGSSHSEVVRRLVESHEATWEDRWATRVTVTGTSPSVLTANRALVYAWYNLHACCSRTASCDLAGTTLASGSRVHDDLCNLMVLTFPSTTARSILNVRYAGLGEARKFANDTLGRLSTKDSMAALFPYPDVFSSNVDVKRRRQAAWTGGPAPGLAVMGTLSAAVDAWNVFRATEGDIGWLADRGYPIIRSAADLVVEGISSNATDGGAGLSLYGVVGRDTRGRALTDPVLPVFGAAASLRAACEASYALRQTPPNLKAWERAMYSFYAPQDDDGVLFPAADPSPPNVHGVFPDPLVALSEPLSSLASASVGVNAFSLLPVNVLSYTDPNAEHGTRGRFSLHDVAEVQALARVAQIAPGNVARSDASSAAFSASLTDFLTNHSDTFSGGFGNLVGNGRGKMHNDLGLSSGIVLAFLQGLAGAYVQGGYTPSGEQYSSLGVNTAVSAVLPAGWESLRIHGIGVDRKDVFLFRGGNTSSYPSSGVPGTPDNSGENMYTPWTVTSLTF